ncbi:MAG: hypothetical protein JWN48_5661 [Myxococcaceae bacterium]|nr:hypothetical protein [Myxococcaceae bacterium]
MEMPDNARMSKNVAKRRGAPRSAEIAWKLAVVDAVLWMGGGELSVYDSVRAVSQVRVRPVDSQIAEGDGLRAWGLSFAGALSAIARGSDVLTDALWAEIDGKAQTLADREYPVNARGSRSAKVERRRAGRVRAVRAELLRAWREGFTLAELAKRRAIEAAAKALQQAYYARAERRADAEVVAEILDGHAECETSAEPCLGTWIGVET